MALINQMLLRYQKFDPIIHTYNVSIKDALHEMQTRFLITLNFIFTIEYLLCTSIKRISLQILLVLFDVILHEPFQKMDLIMI